MRRSYDNVRESSRTQRQNIKESMIEEDNVFLVPRKGSSKDKEKDKENERGRVKPQVKKLLAKDLHPNESILEQAHNEKTKKVSKKRRVEEMIVNDSDNATTAKRSRTGTTAGTDAGVSTISKISDDQDISETEAKYALTPSENQELYSFISNFPGLEDSYKILQKIGEGTFSSVYLAKPVAKNMLPKGIKSTVALKRIYVTSSPQRIYNELKLLYTLRGHRNVAPLLDVLRHEDQVVAVLPYYEHSDFRDFYRDLPLFGIKAYMFDLLKALDFIHSKDIIHRDIKPTNFLYDPFTRRGVLVDFGLAEIDTEPITNKCPCSFGGYNSNTLRQLNVDYAGQFPKNGYLKDDQRPGRRANRAGTRGFRAPEVLFKCNNQSKKIDIWSAGVMLLTLLSRRFPFFNSTDDIEAIMEITNIFGINEMKECALFHGLEFDCNIPKIKDKISLEALIANAVLMDCKEGDTFGEDSPAWELLSAIDKKGVIQDNEVGREYAQAITVLKKSMVLNPCDRLDAKELLNLPFFDEFRDLSKELGYD